MSFTLDTVCHFGGFFCVIGRVAPGSIREFTFSEDIEPERMSLRAIFASDFNYMGTTITPGMTTEEIPTRSAGVYPMTPVSTAEDSYYLNAMRYPYTGKVYDDPPVNTVKVELPEGEEYDIEHDAAIMLAVGTVTVSNGFEAFVVSAPKIIDARVGNLFIIADTDAIFCEAWID